MLYPLRNNVIVLALADPDTWGGSGLIIRPESTKERADQGFVKAIGPDVKEVDVGDYVIFSPYSGKTVNVSDEGDRTIMLAEEGVIAVLTPPTTEVKGLYMHDGKDYIPATSEAALQVIRETFHCLPRTVSLKDKWEAGVYEIRKTLDG